MSKVEDFLENLCQPVDKLEKKNCTFRKLVVVLQYICLLLHVYAQILQYIFLVSYIYYGDYLTAIAPTVCCIAYIITYIGSWRRVRFLLIPNIFADLLVPFFYTYVAITLFVEAGSDKISRYFAGNTSGELQLTAMFLLTCAVSQWLFLFVLYRDYFWIKHNKL